MSTIQFDLERFISEVTAAVKSAGISAERKRTIGATLHQLRSVLSTLLTPTLNEGIDEICVDKLGISVSPVSVGFLRFFPLWTFIGPYLTASQ